MTHQPGALAAGTELRGVEWPSLGVSSLNSGPFAWAHFFQQESAGSDRKSQGCACKSLVRLALHVSENHGVGSSILSLGTSFPNVSNS